MGGHQLSQGHFDLDGAHPMIQKQPNHNARSGSDTLLDKIASDETVRDFQTFTLPGLSIYAIPKTFDGHVDVIQSNAIRSWASLHPNVEIFLFGDVVGNPRLKQIACEVQAVVLPIKCNELGSPILSDAFSANAISSPR